MSLDNKDNNEPKHRPQSKKTCTPRTMRKSPFGVFNPKRGLAYVEKARHFYLRFGTGLLHPLAGGAGIDAYLMDRGEMPVTASNIERGHFRHRFLVQVRRASISENMRDIGLEPFDVHCQLNGWRIELLSDNVERRTPQRKIRSQARTSARRQRQVMQALDPVLDTQAFMLGSVTTQVLAVVEEISKVTDEAAGKAHRELKRIFAGLGALKEFDPQDLPQLSAGD